MSCIITYYFKNKDNELDSYSKTVSHPHEKEIKHDIKLLKRFNNCTEIKVQIIHINLQFITHLELNNDSLKVSRSYDFNGLPVDPVRRQKGC